MNRSRLTTALLTIGGVVLPVACHALALLGAVPAADWQTGDLHDRLRYVLSARSGAILYPFMLYAATCMTLVLVRESAHAVRGYIRFGVFTGVVVSAWYSLVLGTLLLEIETLASAKWLWLLGLWLGAAAAPLLAIGLARWGLAFRRKLGIPWPFLVAATAILYVVGTVALQPDFVAAVLFPLRAVAIAAMGIVVLACVTGPFLAFAAYLAMSVRLLRWYPQARRFRLSDLLLGLTWAAGFLGACRWAVLESLAQYAQLPTSPPNSCYIATAAARGHTRLVGAREIVNRAGTRWCVNRQLVIFKAAEIAIAALAPRTHRLLRRVYNRLGPCAAACLAHPLLADAAYLLLKLAEIPAALGLRVLLGRQFQQVEQLYGYARSGSAGGIPQRQRQSSPLAQPSRGKA